MTCGGRGSIVDGAENLHGDSTVTPRCKVWTRDQSGIAKNDTPAELKRSKTSGHSGADDTRNISLRIVEVQ